MSFLGRVMSGLSAGASAFVQAYNQASLAPLSEADWTNYDSRLSRYSRLELYYYNKVFTDLDPSATKHLKSVNQGLYKQTRGIYNPIGRLTNLYAGLVYKGRLSDDISGGAIPITTENEAINQAIPLLWKHSNWQAEKSNYVRNGAMLGDSVIKIVDDKDKQKVRMEVLHPGLFEKVFFDAVGNITACTIAYEIQEDPNKLGSKTYWYREVWEEREGQEGKGKVRTFKDDAPFAYFSDASGTPTAEWDNEYGFVPIVWQPHRTTQYNFGEAAGLLCLEKIDELNSLASRIDDQIAKTVNAMWAFSGVRKTPSNANGNTTDNSLQFDDNKDKLAAVYLPTGATATAMVTQLDIGSAISQATELMREIERDMPELALHRIREGGNLTAPGVQAAYADAINLIQGAMDNYDAGLVRAMQMALTVGGVNRFPGYTAFNINSYDRGELEMSIKERPIIHDNLSKEVKVQTLLQMPNVPESLIYDELGYSETDVEQAREESQEQQAQQMQLELVRQQTAAMTSMNNLGAQLRSNGQSTNNPTAPNGARTPAPAGNGSERPR